MIVIITEELFNTECLTVKSECISKSNQYNQKQSTLLIFSTRDSSEVRVHHRASSKTWKWNTRLPFPSSRLPFSLAGSDRQSTLPTDTLASMQQRLDLCPPSFHCGCSAFGILSRRFFCWSPSEQRSDDREPPRIKFLMHGSRFSAGSIFSVLCRCLVQGSESLIYPFITFNTRWKGWAFYLCILLMKAPPQCLSSCFFSLIPAVSVYFCACEPLCVTFSLNKVWKIDDNNFIHLCFLILHIWLTGLFTADLIVAALVFLF